MIARAEVKLARLKTAVRNPGGLPIAGTQEVEKREPRWRRHEENPPKELREVKLPDRDGDEEEIPDEVQAAIVDLEESERE